jgi:hypothetical protein
MPNTFSNKKKDVPMVATLQQMLLTPDTAPAVFADCFKLIEQEVSDMSGVSGAAVKLAYKTVTSFAPGYYHKTVEGLLPQIVEKLEPYWADFSHSGGAEFGDYLAKRGEEVAESLLSVTDGLAADCGRVVILKTYRSVRGSAARHVEAALPRVGELVQKYAV